MGCISCMKISTSKADMNKYSILDNSMFTCSLKKLQIWIFQNRYLEVSVLLDVDILEMFSLINILPEYSTPIPFLLLSICSAKFSLFSDTIVKIVKFVSRVLYKILSIRIMRGYLHSTKSMIFCSHTEWKLQCLLLLKIFFFPRKQIVRFYGWFLMLFWISVLWLLLS